MESIYPYHESSLIEEGLTIRPNNSFPVPTNQSVDISDLSTEEYSIRMRMIEKERKERIRTIWRMKEEFAY